MMTPTFAVTNEIGAAPADLDHRADDEAARLLWEVLAERIEDRRRCSDRIAREEELIDRVVAQPCAQRVGRERPLDRDEPSDAVEREAEAQLDARMELDREDEHERERIGRDQADRLDLDRPDREVERPAVLVAPYGEVPAALDDSDVERQAGTRRR